MMFPKSAKRQSTGKRQSGWALAIFLMGIAVFAIQSATPELVDARGSIVAALAFPVIGYLAFAYGAEWISSQTNWGGEPPAMDDAGGGLPPADEMPPEGHGS